MRIRLICAGLALAGGPALALEPSFDCTRAESGAEEAVCASDALASLDLELARLYELAAGGPHMTAEALAELKATQRGWIKGRDDCWKADDGIEACVARDYALRIAELRTGHADARAGEGASTGPVAILCEGFEDGISATFVNTAAPMVALIWGTDAVAVPQVEAASGAKYAGSGGYLGEGTFWSHGDEATLSIGGAPEMVCRQEEIG